MPGREIRQTRNNCSRPAFRPACTPQSRTVAKAAGVDVTDSSVSVEIGLVKGDSGFSLQAAITAELPGVDRDVAADLLAQAHQRCPYSKAIRGNVDVTLTVA